MDKIPEQNYHTPTIPDLCNHFLFRHCRDPRNDISTSLLDGECQWKKKIFLLKKERFFKEIYKCITMYWQRAPASHNNQPNRSINLDTSQYPHPLPFKNNRSNFCNAFSDQLSWWNVCMFHLTQPRLPLLPPTKQDYLRHFMTTDLCSQVYASNASKIRRNEKRNTRNIFTYRWWHVPSDSTASVSTDS